MPKLKCHFLRVFFFVFFVECCLCVLFGFLLWGLGWGVTLSLVILALSWLWLMYAGLICWLCWKLLAACCQRTAFIGSLSSSIFKQTSPCGIRLELHSAYCSTVKLDCICGAWTSCRGSRRWLHGRWRFFHLSLSQTYLICNFP